MASTGKDSSTGIGSFIEDGSDGESETSPLLSAVNSQTNVASMSMMAHGAAGLQALSASSPDSSSPYGSSPTLLTNINGSPAPASSGPSHCHREGEQDSQLVSIQKARRKLIFAAIFCLLFTIAEATGGILSGSLALLTDAAHMLSDFAGFLISLFALWVAQKPATKKMSFGFYRAEVVGALASVFLIWILTGILVYQAIIRIKTGQHNIDAKIMLITSGMGVAVNILLAFILHQSGNGHVHSHGGMSHSHGAPSRDDDPNSGKDNINVRAAFVHVIGDMVQSVGVMIAAYIIYYHPDYSIADPICTFLFSILVLFTTLTIFRDGIHVLMEGSPKDIPYNTVKRDLEAIDGVRTAHNLHMWSLTMGKSAMAVHLVVDPNHVNKQQAVLEEAQRIAKTKYGMVLTTIQVEIYQPAMDNCTMCQDPKD